MENLLFLGVPILKHIRVYDKLVQWQSDSQKRDPRVHLKNNLSNWLILSQFVFKNDCFWVLVSLTSYLFMSV